MSCPTIVTIQPTECIGNSLNTINNNYQSLKTGLCDNQDQINALRTLLLDLSSNMNQIMNVPYIEIAQVVAPTAAAQQLYGVGSGSQYIPYQRLELNTIVQNTRSVTGVSINANIFTLPAGTYNFKAYLRLSHGGGTNSTDGAYIFALYNTTDSSFITRRAQAYVANQAYSHGTEIEGQFKINTSSNFDLRALIGIPSGRKYYVASWSDAKESFATSQNDATWDQRTTIKLWKVG